MRFTGFITEGRDTDPFDVVEELYAMSFPFIKDYLKNFRPGPTAGMMWSGRDSSDVSAVKRIRNDRRPKDTPEHQHDYMDDAFHQQFGVRYRSNSIFVTGKIADAESYGSNVYGIFPAKNNYSFIHSNRIRDLWTDVLENNSYIGMEESDIIDSIIDDYNYNGDDDAREYLTDQFHEMNSQDGEDFQYEDEDGDMVFDEIEWDSQLDDYIDNNIDEYTRQRAEEEASLKMSNVEDDVYDAVRTYKENDLKGAINSESEIMLSGSSYLMIRYDYIPYVQHYMKEMGSQKPNRQRWAEAMKTLDIKKYPRRAHQKDSQRHFKRYINDDLLSMMDN
jgi:hypothetical protein